ncbi:hypothetical protein RRG08_034983 [Elysia crispata]|uniref:Uncharacterized protein n=1 Tax=Elysia crispata TaxID=231223 RepID=A0AAE0Y2J5_9GAST|nr:hypothetical protein RRG08_034983 [Elysia crispata]
MGQHCQKVSASGITLHDAIAAVCNAAQKQNRKELSCSRKQTELPWRRARTSVKLRAEPRDGLRSEETRRIAVHGH